MVSGRPGWARKVVQDANDHNDRDQELRFIVHESPDYQKIKISVFSEDKRTDLVGEAWVDLAHIIIPGGGKSDLWQSLTFKGKYAGELRIELTYYDERPKPPEVLPGQESGDSSKVKRRPLPSTSYTRHVTPDTIPVPGPPGRARHGPRDFRTPPRANTMPPEVNHPLPHPGYAAPRPSNGHVYGSWPGSQFSQSSPSFHEDAYQEDAYQQYEEPQAYADGDYDGPIFLPELTPSTRQRASLPMPPHVDTRQPHKPLNRPAAEHMILQHSHSSPAVPTTQLEQPRWDDGRQLRTDLPEPIPDVAYQHQQLEKRSRAGDFSVGWQLPQREPRVSRSSMQDENPPPPPPPLHSNSSPAVPQRVPGQPASSPLSLYGITTPNTKLNSVPNSSPLRSLERKYAASRHTPGQDSSPTRITADACAPPLEHRAYSSPPSGYSSGHTPSSLPRQQGLPRSTPNRQSITDPYGAGTPTRPHPLSQQVSQARSPPDPPRMSPYGEQQQAYPTQYRSREGLPLMRPRPLSPQVSPPPSVPQPGSVPRSKSTYDIQYPVRAFESADNSPLSTSQPTIRVAQLSNPATPMRKSMSPQATSPHSAGAVPYSPDSFNVHNPTAQPTTLPAGNSPHSPYQIRPGSEALPRDEPNGPIIDSHGNAVDPSDRLPTHSWAPEPEKKPPTRAYGLGRDRDFGPRTPLSAESGASKNISKDTIVNMRPRSQTQLPPPEPTSSRNRLQKRTTSPVKSPMTQPLQERHNFNSTFVPSTYEEPEFNASYLDGPYEQAAYTGSYAAMSEDALSREISSIDIGGARHVRAGSVPAPTAYVPVRSHRDRKSFY